MSKVETRLNKLDKGWPDHLMLFAWSGLLCLVNRKTGQVITTFPKIECDGGDPDSTFIGEETYLMHLMEM